VPSKKRLVVESVSAAVTRSTSGSLYAIGLNGPFSLFMIPKLISDGPFDLRIYYATHAIRFTSSRATRLSSRSAPPAMAGRAPATSAATSWTLDLADGCGVVSLVSRWTRRLHFTGLRRCIRPKVGAATKTLYCMVVWAVTVPLLMVVSSIALRPLAANALARTLYHVRWSLVVLWLTAVILLILVRFWGYWSTLI
jgi:hypothetical protein